MTKTAFLFPGQGAQFVGMSKDIAEGSAAAMAALYAADTILGGGITDLAWNGPEEELNKTENTQPCMMAAEIAALRALEENGIRADAAAGFSLGEWPALVAAGVLPYEKALELVRLRAGYMQEAVPAGEGGMAVVLGKSAEEVEALCAAVTSGYIAPSNYNCPGQITVAGERKGLDEFLKLAQEKGVTAKELAVSIPSHCRLMEPAARRLSEAIGEVAFADAAIPVYANASGTASTSGEEIRENLIRQLTMPVLFEQTLYHMIEDGFDTFIEIGPGKVTSGLVKKCAKAKKAKPAVYRAGDMETLKKCLDELKNDD